MNNICIDGVDTSLYGQRVKWEDIVKKYPDHCVYYSDPIGDGKHGRCLDYCTVIIYGVSDRGSEEGREFYRTLISKGINAGMGYTQIHGGLGALWLS